MTGQKQSKEDWELQQMMDARIETHLKTYDERLWERIRAYVSEQISPKFQQLFFGYGLLRWVAGIVFALALGTLWQLITSFSGGGS